MAFTRSSDNQLARKAFIEKNWLNEIPANFDCDARYQRDFHFCSG
jgi:hypothetical protein